MSILGEIFNISMFLTMCKYISKLNYLYNLVLILKMSFTKFHHVWYEFPNSALAIITKLT